MAATLQQQNVLQQQQPQMYTKTSARDQSVSPPSTDTEDEGVHLSNSPSAHLPQTALASISEAEDSNRGYIDDDNEVESERDDGDLDDEIEQIGGGMLKEMVLKSGYLLKKGERRKNWKKRFFVLRPDRLCYYKDDREYQILRNIAIAEVHACATVEVKRHDNCFGIVTPRRTYYVRTQSEREIDDWVYKINQARADSEARLHAEHDGSNDTTPLNTTANTPMTREAQPAASASAAPQASTSQALPATAPIPISGSATATQVSGARAIPIRDNAMSLGSSYPISSSLASTSSFSSPSDASRNPDAYLSSSYASNASSSDAFPALIGGSLAMPPSGYNANTARNQPVDATLRGVNSRNLPTSSTLPGPASTSDQEASYFPPLDALSSSDEEDDPNVPFSFQSSPQMPDLPLAQPSSSAPAAGPSKIAQKSGGAATDPHRVVMSGYLMKATKRKNWRKRWFTLTSQKLIYSRSHIDTKHSREVPLDRVLDAMEYTPSSKGRSLGGPLSPMLGQSSEAPLSPTTESGKKPLANCFKIITPSRTYVVCAPSEEDEIKWLSALRVLIAASRKPVTGSPADPAQYAWQQGAQASAAAQPRAPAAPASNASQQQPAPAVAQTTITQTNASGGQYPSIESKLEEAASTSTSVASQPDPTRKVRPLSGGSALSHHRSRSATEVALSAIQDIEKSFRMAKT